MSAIKVLWEEDDWKIIAHFVQSTGESNGAVRSNEEPKGTLVVSKISKKVTVGAGEICFARECRSVDEAWLFAQKWLDENKDKQLYKQLYS